MIPGVEPEDADLVFALERVREVNGVYALVGAPRDWPRLFVALSEDSGHALGVVTGLIVRALPHRDRSYIGVAATARLRELWTPIGAPLTLSPTERLGATARAHERERAHRTEPAASEKIRTEEPAPVSVPVLGPFKPGVVWTMSNQRVVVLEAMSDPFREPPPSMLIISEDDRLFDKLAHTAPRTVTLERARTAKEATNAIERTSPQHIVCSESLALGDHGVLEWLETNHPTLTARFEIVCKEGSADWLASYLETRASHRMEILEQPLEDEAIVELMDRATKRRV